MIDVSLIFQMKTPAIQNDFSYYRRSVRCSGDTGSVSIELANRMSLFFAHATPMLKVLTDATATFLKQVYHSREMYIMNLKLNNIMNN